jgi:hypothetical protein
MRMLVSPHLPAVSHPSSRKTLQRPRTRRRVIGRTPRRARMPRLIKRDRAPTQPTIPDLVLILRSPRMLLQIIPNRPLTQQGHWTAPALDVYSTVTSSARRHSSASVLTSPARAYPQTNSSHRRPGARSQPNASSG